MKGTVVKSTGSWYQVLAENNKVYQCRLKGNFRLKGQKNTNPITVGDHVKIEVEENTHIAVISSLEERKNYIIRRLQNFQNKHILLRLILIRPF